jgi:hypothetical protein
MKSVNTLQACCGLTEAVLVALGNLLAKVVSVVRNTSSSPLAVLTRDLLRKNAVVEEVGSLGIMFGS